MIMAKTPRQIPDRVLPRQKIGISLNSSAAKVNTKNLPSGITSINRPVIRNKLKKKLVTVISILRNFGSRLKQ